VVVTLRFDSRASIASVEDCTDVEEVFVVAVVVGVVSFDDAVVAVFVFAGREWTGRRLEVEEEAEEAFECGGGVTTS
jgi:hypothetical protein